MKTNFPTPNLFVVIHCLESNDQSIDHVLKSAYTACNSGADGVFLIPDYAKPNPASLEEVIFYYEELKRLQGVKGLDFFKIGISCKLPLYSDFTKNFLTILFEKKFEMVCIKKSVKESGWEEYWTHTLDTEFFSSLSSKNEDIYQESLKVEIPVIDDSDIDLDKIKEIRSYLPIEKRLALGSGVTLENISSYLDVGITDFFVDFNDGETIKHMVEIIREHKSHD